MKKELPFFLPDNILEKPLREMAVLNQELVKYQNSIGQNSNKFKLIYKEITDGLSNYLPIYSLLHTKLHLRALAPLLNDSKFKPYIIVNSKLLCRIGEITSTPSTLLLEALLQYFYNDFDEIAELGPLSHWLLDMRKKRGILGVGDVSLISTKGVLWFVEYATINGIEPQVAKERLKLSRYTMNRFMACAMGIFYLKELESIPTNQPHEILSKLKKESVFNSRYDESTLLGHHILRILIKRAPVKNVCQDWVNLLLYIAGDPRINESNPRFIRWWSKIDVDDVSKARGWLSKVDLTLFLQALKDFSESKNKADLQRMYPARKVFLEGLLNNDFILETRLFLSSEASLYLRNTYKQDELPDFRVINGDKSVLYIGLSGGAIIEGSHNCRMYIYESLPTDNYVTSYQNSKNNELSYRDLTIGLKQILEQKGVSCIDMVQHTKSNNFSWQKRAVSAIKKLNVDVEMKDVLTPKDYGEYTVRFGYNY